MKTFSWTDILDFLNTGNQNPFFSTGTGLSIGSFDGMHKGHRKLINSLVSECKKQTLKSGVITFLRPLPSIKHSGDYKGDLSTLQQRLEIFEQLGIDFAIIVDFTDDFSSMLGTDFLNILVNACNMELLAEGIDFRCGYKGATDTQAIRYFAENNNVQTIFVDPLYYSVNDGEEERISSSYIRSMILKGFFTTANELLERPYELDFTEQITSVECNSLTQVVPPPGIYHCQNEKNQEVRVEITKEKILCPSSKRICFK